MSRTAVLRYRMSSKDEFYAGGIVNGSRCLTLMEDVAKRLVAEKFGDNGRCTGVETIRLHAPVIAGDYMEFIARVVEDNDDKLKIETRAYTIGGAPENPEFASSVDIYEDPYITTTMTMIYEPRK